MSQSKNEHPGNLSEEDLVSPKLVGAQHQCTEAGYRFLLRHSQLIDFYFFQVSLAQYADRARYTVLKVHSILSDEEEPLKQFEEAKSNPEPASMRLGSFTQLRVEALQTNGIDNFLAFLSESLQSCMLKKPEILKSNEQVTVDEILSFSTQEELVDFLVNRKINQLSYGGFSQLNSFFESRLGLSITPSSAPELIDLLRFGIELRNVYVHNRGIINEIFLKRVGKLGKKFGAIEGKRFSPDFNFQMNFMNAALEVSIQLDDAVSKKFGVRRKKFSIWDEPRIAKLKAREPIEKLDS